MTLKEIAEKLAAAEAAAKTAQTDYHQHYDRMVELREDFRKKSVAVNDLKFQLAKEEAAESNRELARRKRKALTRKQIEAMPGIAEVNYEGGESGWWAYTVDGYQFAGMGCHTAHEDTLWELSEMVKTIEPCTCGECLKGKGVAK